MYGKMFKFLSEVRIRALKAFFEKLLCCFYYSFSNKTQKNIIFWYYVSSIRYNKTTVTSVSLTVCGLVYGFIGHRLSKLINEYC